MVRTSLEKGEITLNSVKFKLAKERDGSPGEVRPFYASQFAAKQVIGDFSKDSDPNRSTWTFFSDQTEGIGIEDMGSVSVESLVKFGENVTKHSYWTDLNVDYPGYGTLPKLASTIALPTLPTLVDGAMENWTASTALTNWTKTLSGGGATLTQSAGTVHGGTYSAKLTSSLTDYADIAATVSSWSNDFRNTLFTIQAWTYVHTAAGANPTITIDDGVGTTVGTINGASTGAWAQTTLSHTVAGAATGLVVSTRAVQGGAGGTQYFVDDITIPAMSTTVTPRCDFNGDSFYSSGKVLLWLSHTDGSIRPMGMFPATITDVIASVGNSLYVLQGDSDSYWFMTTTPTFTKAVGSDGAGGGTSSAATLGITWNNKLCKITAAGQLAYSATPNSATPTWTANGLIATSSLGTPVNLVTNQDAYGTDTIFCATTLGLLMHDSTNSLWLNTGLKIPSHTDNGKGLISINDKLYYSAGLAVYELRFEGNTSIITPVGLDVRDGLPDSYVGSITKLIGGYEGEFFALLDASLISASNFSSIIKYTKDGHWRPIWSDGTANRTMNGALSTSVYAYRLWAGVAGGLIWLPLDRARRNPLKVSASTFAPTGMYISPWFDANWPSSKNALATRLLALSSSSTEIINLRYRTDKATTDVVASTAGWTLIDTLVAADAGVESVVTFGSGVGTTFKNIQFRLDLERAAGTTTNRPILVYGALEYERLITAKWGWGFTVDCTENYGGKEPHGQLEAIKTAVESQTLIPFQFGGLSEPKYVRIKPAEGERLTGAGQEGTFRLVAVEK